MEKKIGRLPVTLITVLAAAVALILRHMQLRTALDEMGNIMVGAGKGPLTWVCVAFVLLALVYSFLLKPGKTMEQGGEPLVMVLTLCAAFLMALGSAAVWHTARVIAFGGLVTAVCWVIIALKRHQKELPSAVLFMLPALFYAIDLIVEFRDWSRDPVILDYCFELFARIAVMCATFHLGGFSLEKGRRKMTVFFCLCGVVFSATAMAGAGLSGALTAAAAALWLLANVWIALREE